MATQTAKLNFEHVTKVFPTRGGGVRAVDDLTLSVGEQEFVCLLGPSGCGKSTLLDLAAGFEAPTEGAVLVDGVRVREPGPQRGMVFQDGALFPWLTALENVSYGPRIRGVRKASARKAAIELLASVGLAGFEHRFPHELSGGMRQRVAIVRALANEPELLLMDEPFGALDPHTRMNMQDLLVSLWREVEATVFFVTHSIEEAVFLGDRVYILSNSPGTILQELKVDPADRPSQQMQREPRFQETVGYIRDLISKLEESRRAE